MPKRHENCKALVFAYEDIHRMRIAIALTNIGCIVTQWADGETLPLCARSFQPDIIVVGDTADDRGAVANVDVPVIVVEKPLDEEQLLHDLEEALPES